MRVFYAKDADLSLIKGKNVTIIGDGSQGLTSEHSIEVVGEKLRAMMPWIKATKLVDRSRN